MIDDDDRIVRAGFHRRVFDVVRRVPAGRVSTYGDVAAALGSPRVARHVGFALAACAEPDVPWHRVVNAKGTLSGRGDLQRVVLQRALLEREGVRFDARGRLDLRALRWRSVPDLG